jgi:hypothetical protein
MIEGEHKMTTKEELVKAVWDAAAVRAAAAHADWDSAYDAWDAARQALKAYDKEKKDELKLRY